MSEQDYKVRYERLLDKVRQMRGWQREYLKYHVQGDLPKVVHAEREVDKIIKEEVKILKSKQSALFNR